MVGWYASFILEKGRVDNDLAGHFSSCRIDSGQPSIVQNGVLSTLTTIFLIGTFVVRLEPTIGNVEDFPANQL